MEIKWQYIGHSILGATHERTGMGNQDALNSSLLEDGKILCIAVSDGHGGSKYFRSKDGAEIAVRVAVETLTQVYKEMKDFSSVKRILEEQLPKMLIQKWVKNVKEHLNENRISEAEWDILKAREGEVATDVVKRDERLAYGATLLTVLLTDSYAIYLQLGDGDILIVPKDGEVLRPFPKDDRLIANETTSLCSPNAWCDFQHSFQVFVDRPPALIAISSDGYANSFPNETEFKKVGTDLLAMVRQRGLKNIGDELKAWLNEASKKGSGDDITIALAYKVDGMSGMNKAENGV